MYNTMTDEESAQYYQMATEVNHDARLDHDKKYYSALAQCAERYFEMVDDLNYYSGGKASDLALWNFIYEFKCGIRDRLPLMKLNRWLGYIQGCLIEKSLTTVQVERDWTRPLFGPLDYEN